MVVLKQIYYLTCQTFPVPSGVPQGPLELIAEALKWGSQSWWVSLKQIAHGQPNALWRRVKLGRPPDGWDMYTYKIFGHGWEDTPLTNRCDFQTFFQAAGSWVGLDCEAFYS